MRHLRITIGNRSYEVTVEDLSEGGQAIPTPRGVVPAAAPLSTPTPVASSSPQDAGPGSVISPMAGSILTVLVKVGDSVTKGQPLLILEAMKMENQISAPRAGTVKSVDAAEGTSVAEGHVLMTLE
jgi:biotin carboxyl carrier protein